MPGTSPQAFLDSHLHRCCFKLVMHLHPQELPVAVGVDPQLKVLMRSLQKVPHGRPEFCPHLDAFQSEQLPFLFRQPHSVICQV